MMSLPHEEIASDLREVSAAASPTAGHIETEMAALAGRFVNSTARNIFLSGKAGTGKTTFLHQLAQRTHKRFIILAPTGIAALNAGGVTIHSQFLLPFGSFVPERKLPDDIPEYGAFHDRDTLNRRHPLNSPRRNVLRAVDLLIVDEVSMLRADVLDAIDHRMRSVRQRHEPFGGAQVLFIGDLYQLPPVVKDHEMEVMRRWYPNMHFFSSLALRESGCAHIELDRVFRQRDERFIHILNNLRDNTVTREDVDTLNVHFRPVITAQESEGVVTLTTHNRTADDLNQRALEKLPGAPHTFQAEVEGDFPESMFPVARTIELKEGAQIMFIRNDVEKMYFNGKLARVTKVNEDGAHVVMLDNGSSYTLKRVKWENKRYTVDAVTKEQKEQVIGTFEHYPVKLAWAITVHKSQGLTFDRAIVDVGQAFAPGQVYVALSRLRTLDGLILRTRIDPSVVSTDPDVVAFSAKRHTQPPLPEQLREEQQRYVRTVLTETFDLGDLRRRVEHTRKDHASTAEFEDESMRTVLQRLGDKLRAEEDNTRKFQDQLLRLLRADDRDTLLERITKGADYYGALLKEAMKDLLRHLEQVQNLSRTKQYADALREIDGMLVKKADMMARALHITTCILNGREVVKLPEQDRMLAAERASMVADARSWAEEHAPATSRKSGRRRKQSEPGDPDDADAAMSGSSGRGRSTIGEGKKPKLKGETYLRTYALVKMGRSPAEIAAERGLSPSTIESHFARGLADGVLEIDGLMPADAREVIADWMRENPGKGLNDARARFADTYSYGQLRMVQAWLRKEGGDG